MKQSQSGFAVVGVAVVALVLLAGAAYTFKNAGTDNDPVALVYSTRVNKVSGSGTNPPVNPPVKPTTYIFPFETITSGPMYPKPPVKPPAKPAQPKKPCGFFYVGAKKLTPAQEEQYRQLIAELIAQRPTNPTPKQLADLAFLTGIKEGPTGFHFSCEIGK